MERDFEVAWYGKFLCDESDRNFRYRMLMHDLPRGFHALPRQMQVDALKKPPPLTGTDWDAFLAAVVEHVAWLHEHPIPAWCNEPARFAKHPWVVSSNPVIAIDSVLYPPPAFVRHNVFPDPSDLDARGGERFVWAPK